GLQQKHRASRLCQPCGERSTPGTGADYDVIERAPVVHWTSLDAVDISGTERLVMSADRRIPPSSGECRVRRCYLLCTVSIARPATNLSERLQEGDQRPLVGVTEVGAEVMAAVDDVIRAFAQCEEPFSHICEDPACLVVRGVRRQRLQVA